jgi:hypothetical protein
MEPCLYIPANAGFDISKPVNSLLDVKNHVYVLYKNDGYKQLSGQQYWKWRDSKESEAANIVVSFEFKSVEEVANHVGKCYDRDIVLLLRDWFNLLASKRRSGSHNNANFSDYVSMWKRHASTYLYTDSNVLGLYFASWFSSRLCRSRLAKAFAGALEYDDKIVNEMTPIGGGSSFTGLDYNGKAQEMPMLERYKDYLDDPEYKELVMDTEAIMLNNAVSLRELGHVLGALDRIAG